MNGIPFAFYTPNMNTIYANEVLVYATIESTIIKVENRLIV